MLVAQRLTHRARRWVPLPKIAIRVLAIRRLALSIGSTRRLSFHRRRNHQDHFLLRAAALVDDVDRNVCLGSSVRGAIQSAVTGSDAELSATLRVLMLHCRTGAPLDADEVLDDAANRSVDEGFLIRSLVAAGAGGQAASFCLQRTSWALRERHAISAERRVYASQAVFAARILSWLPVVFGGLMAATNESVRSVYFGGPIGLLCVIIGVGLNVVGRRWMKRITCSFG